MPLKAGNQNRKEDKAAQASMGAAGNKPDRGRPPIHPGSTLAAWLRNHGTAPEELILVLDASDMGLKEKCMRYSQSGMDEMGIELEAKLADTLARGLRGELSIPVDAVAQVTRASVSDVRRAAKEADASAVRAKTAADGDYIDSSKLRDVLAELASHGKWHTCESAGGTAGPSSGSGPSGQKSTLALWAEDSDTTVEEILLLLEASRASLLPECTALAGGRGEMGADLEGELAILLEKGWDGEFTISMDSIARAADVDIETASMAAKHINAFRSGAFEHGCVNSRDLAGVLDELSSRKGASACHGAIDEGSSDAAHAEDDSMEDTEYNTKGRGTGCSSVQDEADASGQDTARPWHGGTWDEIADRLSGRCHSMDIHDARRCLLAMPGHAILDIAMMTDSEVLDALESDEHRKCICLESGMLLVPKETFGQIIDAILDGGYTFIATEQEG